MAWHAADLAATYIEAGGHPLCGPPDDVETGFMAQGCDGLPVIWVTRSPECFITELTRRGVRVLGWVGCLAWDAQAPADASALLDEGGPPP